MTCAVRSKGHIPLTTPQNSLDAEKIGSCRVFSAMKNTLSRHPHDTLQTALRSAFPMDARRLTVLAALILAMIQARSVVLYTLKNHVQLPGSRTVRYQRLLRFVQFVIPDSFFPRFALQFLGDRELWLILDRTNWKLGQANINILLLSAVWNGFSLPLMWSLLPHGGSSAQQTREALVERFLRAFPEVAVCGLLADREFIGRSWFNFLQQHRIAPCIRLPSTATVGQFGMPVWACFKNMQVGEVRSWHRKVEVYGVSLRLGATKSVSGDMLYLAYWGCAKKNLRRYAGRWQTENLHAALKTRGFNLEDTGLVDTRRVSTLLMAVSLAFIWACHTGELMAAKQPRKVKKHGYAEVSLFRLGLDELQDLLLHPNPTSWTKLSNFILRFEG